MAKMDYYAGYRTLDSWVMASIVKFATQRFCDKFLTRELDPKGRQYDQMTQAARSGKMNIVEGSARHATSKETEMKLTDVSRASLNELMGDYEDWLLYQEIVPWHINSEEAKAVLAVRLDKPVYTDDWVHDSGVHLLKQQSKFAKWLRSNDSTIVANCIIILIRRTITMLSGQLQTQLDKFEKEGGFRERLTQIRVDERAKNADAPTCPNCGKPMTIRKAASGKNVGKEFWGCTGYPACKGVRGIEPENKSS